MLVGQGPGNTLRLIRQPDHAALSGQLAERWRQPGIIPHAMWSRVIEAIRQHDIGWHAAERAPALDAHGRPHSFKTLPASQHVLIWRDGVSRAGQMDVYAGLLVALHGRWLYTTFAKTLHRDKQREVESFVRELDQQIDALIQALRAGDASERAAVEPEALAAARALVTAMDGLSLMLCGALPFGPVPGPVAYDDHEASIGCTATDGGARIEPWPFAGEAFTVTVPAHDVPDRAYADANDLTQALQSAETTHLHFAVRPA